MFHETGYNQGRKLKESPLHDIPFSWGISFAMVKIHVTGNSLLSPNLSSTVLSRCLYLRLTVGPNDTYQNERK